MAEATVPGIFDARSAPRPRSEPGSEAARAQIRRLTRTLRVADGAMRAYVARPDPSDAPAVIVLHGAEGLDERARSACDAIAALGYLALCPDLFWRRGDAHANDDRRDASDAPQRFDPARAAADIAETVDAIRRETLDHADIAVIGRGPDGLLAAFAAGAGRLGAPVLAIGVLGGLAEPGSRRSDERIQRVLERWLGPGIVSGA